MTWEYRGYKGLQGLTGGYKGLQRVTRETGGDKRLQRKKLFSNYNVARYFFLVYFA